ncbi:hypothetical protein GCM10011344_04980 [Dokdonia pacifica]|uniref:IrrE N-terminal-like domain-containing protein n=1 Tax=Dokdonia pacifica TaxID=1627892 RepID=A0A238ZME0_9FLAO|nr:hypothetical protein [Dokdonia pacifica]GGG07440.1 hypothetical protein GCM10011344_04980 [Dokdonia pacifica]SNR84575.1 hypothetical protein SAMN06265376_103361 [Dokdonia pacifica]
MQFHKNTLEVIIHFLTSIHILVVEEALTNDTFLPGLQLKGGTILLDKEKLQYPGDLLHEAGHIAITDKELRPLIGTKEMDPAWPSDGDEIATILWSYAAATHLSIDLTILFHSGGYKNDSEWLIEQFTNKNYVGLPLLEWMELCDSKEFPIMKKWLR